MTPLIVCFEEVTLSVSGVWTSECSPAQLFTYVRNRGMLDPRGYWTSGYDCKFQMDCDILLASCCRVWFVLIGSCQLQLTACLCMHAITEILLVLVYRAVKSCGWRIENRLMRDLVQDNLLYFCCGFGWCSRISHMPPNLLSGYYSFFHLCPSHHEISSGKFVSTLEAAPLTRALVSSSTPSSRVCEYSHFRRTITYSQQVSGHCSDNLGHPNAQGLLEIGSLFL